jgi:acyl-coenzyme A thioesterase PaaI-like protein
MMATLGARLLHADNGRVVISAPIDPAFNQQHGAAHAAVAFALGDSAAGYAALTRIAPPKPSAQRALASHGHGRLR